MGATAIFRFFTRFAWDASAGKQRLAALARSRQRTVHVFPARSKADMIFIGRAVAQLRPNRFCRQRNNATIIVQRARIFR